MLPVHQYDSMYKFNTMSGLQIKEMYMYHVNM